MPNSRGASYAELATPETLSARFADALVSAVGGDGVVRDSSRAWDAGSRTVPKRQYAEACGFYDSSGDRVGVVYTETRRRSALGTVDRAATAVLFPGDGSPPSLVLLEYGLVTVGRGGKGLGGRVVTSLGSIAEAFELPASYDFDEVDPTEEFSVIEKIVNALEAGHPDLDAARRQEQAFFDARPESHERLIPRPMDPSGWRDEIVALMSTKLAVAGRP